MIRTISIGLIAVAAVTTLAFKASTNETITNKNEFKEANKTTFIHTTNYSVDTKQTTSTWLAKKIGGQHTGGISLSSGTINVDHGTIKSGTFSFDMTSITCTDLADAEWNKKLIDHLKSDDFFSVTKNPTVKFELTKAVLKSENNYDVTGKLTIKGITNEITFPALIKMDDKKMVTVAKIMVNRTKFDIKYGSKTFFESIGDKAIDDEFELSINVVALVK